MFPNFFNHIEENKSIAPTMAYSAIPLRKSKIIDIRRIKDSMSS